MLYANFMLNGGTDYQYELINVLLKIELHTIVNPTGINEYQPISAVINNKKRFNFLFGNLKSKNPRSYTISAAVKMRENPSNNRFITKEDAINRFFI